MKIDIIISQNDNDDDQYEFGWPNIDDPVGSPRSLNIEFFDGATKRQEVNFVEKSDSNEIVLEGDLRYIVYPRMNLIITYTKDDADVEEEWFVVAPSQGVFCRLENENTKVILTKNAALERNIPEDPYHPIQLGDPLPDTITKVEVWMDVEWGGAQILTKVFEDDPPMIDHYYRTENTPESAPITGNFAPTNNKIEIYAATDSKVPQSCIDREYDESNDKRWDRRPIRNLSNTSSDPAELIPKEEDSDKQHGSSVSDGARWLLTAGFYNILLEVKNEETTKYRAAPNDLVTYENDPFEELRKKSDFKNKADNTTYNLKKTGLPTPKIDIAVSEMGSKSIGHHLDCHYDRPNAHSIGYYGYEYITKEDNVTNGPMNLFFNCFNTGDKTNFKITKESRYDAQEYTGKVIALNANTKVDVFLMPRRWAYTTRSRETVREAYQLTQVVHCQAPCTGGDVEEELCSPPPEFHELGTYKMDQGYHDYTFQPERDCHMLITAFDRQAPPLFEMSAVQYELSCSGCATVIDYDFIVFGYNIGVRDCHGWPLIGYLEIGFIAGFQSPDQPSFMEGGVLHLNLCMPAWGFSNNVFAADCSSLEINWVATADMHKISNTHKYGVWWDRFPSNMQCFRNIQQGTSVGLTRKNDIVTEINNIPGSTEPEASAVTFYDANYGMTGVPKPLLLKGDEHWDDIMSEFSDANSGFSSFHYFVQTRSSKDEAISINREDPIPPGFSTFTTYSMRSPFYYDNMAEFGHFLPPQYFGTPTTTDDDIMVAQPLKEIWEKIAGNEDLDVDASWFWTNHKAPEDSENPWNRVDNIPFGTGISPTKTGDLVGIVKVGNTPFYIWRKTDETFSFLYHEIEGNYVGENITFEGRTRDDTTEIIHPDINGGDALMFDQFITSEYRKIEKVGRKITVVTTTEKPDGSHCNQDWATIQEVTTDDTHSVDLSSPIYVIASREWSLKTYTDPYTAPNEPGKDLQPARVFRKTFDELLAENNGNIPYYYQKVSDNSEPTHEELVSFFATGSPPLMARIPAQGTKKEKNRF
jgi:hypothetical protein